MEYVITAATFVTVYAVVIAARIYLPRLVRRDCYRVVTPVTHLVRNGFGDISVEQWEAMPESEVDLPVVAIPHAEPLYPVATPWVDETPVPVTPVAAPQTVQETTVPEVVPMVKVKTPKVKVMTSAAQVTTQKGRKGKGRDKNAVMVQVRDLIEKGHSRREVGRMLDIPESTLRGWMK